MPPATITEQHRRLAFAVPNCPTSEDAAQLIATHEQERLLQAHSDLAEQATLIDTLKLEASQFHAQAGHMDDLRSSLELATQRIADLEANSG